MKYTVSEYFFHTGRLPGPLRFLVVGDLHNSPWEELLPLLDGVDALLVPGDIADRYRGRYEKGLAFLKECSRRLPVFVSLGNHDVKMEPFPPYLEALEATGAQILDNQYREFRGLAIAGALIHPFDEEHCAEVRRCLEAFYQSPLPKLLLCHKPEQAQFQDPSCRAELILSAHAHGGQIRLFGRGLFSPGQGIFPKLTKGFERPNLLVTTGFGNPVGLPRWGNPREVILLTMD